MSNFFIQCFQSFRPNPNLGGKSVSLLAPATAIISCDAVLLQTLRHPGR